MPNWLSIVITILSIYIAISVALYYLQDYMLFKPEKLPIDFQFDYDNQETKEYNLETRDGATINGLRFFPKGESKGIVLYLKGNSKSIKGWGKFAVDFTRHGYNVLMVDYRGFGKSTGRRSQKAIKRDLQLVYDKVKEQTTEDRIILYGRSLGFWICSKTGLNEPPKITRSRCAVLQFDKSDGTLYAVYAAVFVDEISAAYLQMVEIRAMSHPYHSRDTG